jgi:hypothetical protein
MLVVDCNGVEASMERLPAEDIGSTLRYVQTFIFTRYIYGLTYLWTIYLLSFLVIIYESKLSVNIFARIKLFINREKNERTRAKQKTE